MDHRFVQADPRQRRVREQAVRHEAIAYMVLRGAILAHPTMAEGLNDLFATIPAPS
jgi:hypothetical protein